MTDKKFIDDEEIIKALECCKDCCCKQCDEEPDFQEAINLINRQKSEIEKLNGELIHALSELSLTRTSLNITKVKAYKEFAEKVNEEITKAYNNNSEVLREHLRKHGENPDFEFIAAIQGKMNALRGLDDFIDNLLKEMAGEEE